MRVQLFRLLRAAARPQAAIVDLGTGDEVNEGPKACQRFVDGRRRVSCSLRRALRHGLLESAGEKTTPLIGDDEPLPPLLDERKLPIARLEEHPLARDDSGDLFLVPAADVRVTPAEPDFADVLLFDRFEVEGIDAFHRAFAIQVEASPRCYVEPAALLVERNRMPHGLHDGVVAQVRQHLGTQAAIRLDGVPDAKEVDNARPLIAPLPPAVDAGLLILHWREVAPCLTEHGIELSGVLLR